MVGNNIYKKRPGRNMRYREITEREARSRNLLIAIAKTLVERDMIESAYSKKDIIEQFHFSQRDIKYQLNTFFINDGEVYNLRPKICTYLNKILRAHKKVMPRLEDAKVAFFKCFGRLSDQWEKSRSVDYTIVHKVCQDIKDVAAILHWGCLPIIDKNLMINSNQIPEENLTAFYNNYDMLYELLKYIRGKGERIEVNGDHTLNKEMTFSVYTRRWGHNDTYRIYRTIDGWEVKRISINGACEKDGTGALIQNLEHDCVFYPKDGVKYAMNNLWEEAEDGKLNIEQLQQKLQQIADWISEVEKAVGYAQPDWVRYY